MTNGLESSFTSTQTGLQDTKRYQQAGHLNRPSHLTPMPVKAAVFHTAGRGGRDLWRSPAPTPCKQGHPERAAQDGTQAGFG